jgi:ABC-type phosphate/phosphonate transport system substrate-binding protein
MTVRPSIATLGAALLASAATLLPPAPAWAADLVFAVQPILSEDKTRQAFQPLADYLGELTDVHFALKTSPNFLSYWNDTYQGKYDVVLDAAHFTDYRARKLGFTVLAKVPEQVSYSLVVAEKNLIFDPSELTGKRVATLGSPSYGAVALEAMFRNPTRQPIVVEVDSAEAGMAALLAGRVSAAILPTPVVALQMESGGAIAVVTVTPQIPHIAVSVGPAVSANVRDAIRTALLTADKTPRGRQMLQKIGFPRFEPASADTYAGHGDILKNTFGY